MNMIPLKSFLNLVIVEAIKVIFNPTFIFRLTRNIKLHGDSGCYNIFIIFDQLL
jgi:hypothetical protein